MPDAKLVGVDDKTPDLEPLPFTVDPLERLRSGGSNGRLEGNVRLNGSTRSTARLLGPPATWLGMSPDDTVLTSLEEGRRVHDPLAVRI